jgi:hypothetical protein
VGSECVNRVGQCWEGVFNGGFLEVC